MMISAFDVV